MAWLAAIGSNTLPTRVIAAIALAKSGYSPSPTAASIAAPSAEVSYTCGRAVGRPKMSAVSCIAASLCEPPPDTRSWVIATPLRFSMRSLPSRSA